MRVGTSPVMTSRLIRLFATLVALSAGVSDGEARASAGPDPTALETARTDIEGRIETLIQRWFAVLEDPSVEAKTLNDLLAEAPFELILNGEALRDRGALLAWVSSLRATYPQIEYQLDSIRIQAEGRDRYRVRFEFDRHALDEAGLPHVARREHIWIVQSDANAILVILRMEERPLLFFPGSGPQIVCY
jgi:hypothetical protein